MADYEHVRRDHGFHALRVKEVVQETDDTCSLVLDVPDELRETFRYRAGQFCTFRVHTGDEELHRSYSMSSAPEVDSDLTVTVKRVPGGAVSNWLNDHVSEADVLEVTKPAGVFCIRDGDRPVVAFCGGSGVTPVMSIAKSVLATSDRPVKLLYANRDPRSVIFDADLRALQNRHPERLEVRHHFDSEAGFLDADAIAGLAKGNEGADFYICGPEPFMDLVEATLHHLAVDPEHIHVERFVAAANPAVPSTPDETSSGTVVPEALTIVLKGTSHTVPYRAGDTVLQTARRGGLQAPYSCEAGDCATCMALLREGTATMRANNALTPEEVGEGWVLTCQARPHGHTVTVEYEAL